MITFVEGSLFSANKGFSLAQCISGDVRYGMFRGISVQFLEHYPGLEQLRSYSVLNLGAVVPVKIRGKFIYNLITKPLHWHKPVPYNLFVALKSMKSHASDNSVRDIAVPFLGSGLDRLDFFNVVFPMNETVFGGTNINIHVYCPASYKRLVILWTFCSIVVFTLPS